MKHSVVASPTHFVHVNMCVGDFSALLNLMCSGWQHFFVRKNKMWEKTTCVLNEKTL